jgi:hypothetical protein
MSSPGRDSVSGVSLFPEELERMSSSGEDPVRSPNEQRCYKGMDQKCSGKQLKKNYRKLLLSD